MSEILEGYKGKKVWISRNLDRHSFYNVKVWKKRPIFNLHTKQFELGICIHSLCYSDWEVTTGHELKKGELFGPCYIGIMSESGIKGEVKK